jgi:tetratricopeptide (TPR) repeat protein
MARIGNLEGAKAETESIKALRAALEKANQSYWADRSEEQILAISAWIALKEGARDQAEKFMRTAADSEDGSVKHVAMENRLYPLRELLAELLLEVGQPTAAQTEYEMALKHTPNRYRALLGMARAAKASGDRKKASDYYVKVVSLAKNADTERPETAEAKLFLSR